MEKLSFSASMGERIRYYRKAAGMTQKELAEECGITESAIRNYELGNRMPDWDTLTSIALSLEVSFFSLSDPSPSAIFGALHIFFLMEEIYGLHPEMVGDKVHLVFNEETYSRNLLDFTGDVMLNQAVAIWENIYQKYINGDMTEEEYMIWKSKYPNFAKPDGTPYLPEAAATEVPAPEKSKKRYRRPKKTQ